MSRFCVRSVFFVAVCLSTCLSLFAQTPPSPPFPSATGNMGTTRFDHTATLLNNGQVLVAGGYVGTGDTNSVEIYDPVAGTFSATSYMLQARELHTATLLSDGRVLVTGGYDGTTTLATAEIYDPYYGWSATGTMNTARRYHTGTLLQDGRVLITGGLDSNGNYLSSAEIFDPSTGIFTATGSMTTVRRDHSATLLLNGKVLITGGYDNVNRLSSAEIFDPAAGTFTATGSMGAAREFQTATLLSNGNVFVAGGFDGSSYLKTAEIFDPTAGTFSAAASMASSRDHHGASRLPDGRVLVTGGFDGSSYLGSAEVYDPATDTFSSTSGMSSGRGDHTTTLLQDGRVLVTGGYDGTSYLYTAEVFSPFKPTTGNMAAARNYSRSTLLNNGTVLITGGTNSLSGTLSTAEVFDPSAGTFTATTGAMTAARYGHAAVLLNDGRVLIVGGAQGYAENGLASAEIYDPATGSFTATPGNMSEQRYEPQATVMADGRVLVSGGYNPNNGGAVTSADIFDPATGLFTATGSMINRRLYPTATLLSDGRVLITGGLYNGPDYSAEVYDPASGTFSFVGYMQSGRYEHTATLLNNGKVLLAGGDIYYSNGTSAEIYDPVANTFTYTTNNLSAPRAWHTATLLQNGQVLLAGGENSGGGPGATADLYDPATNSFQPAGALGAPRTKQSATLLKNGQVLISGGSNQSGELATAELYSAASLVPAGLVSIALPPNAKVAVNYGVPLAAVGTFSDSHTEVLQSLTWNSATTSIATVTNDDSNRGRVFGVAGGTSTVSACAGAICGTTDVSVVAGASDLGLTMTASPSLIASGQTQDVTYTITVTNHGPNTAGANNVVVSDTPPPGVSLKSITSTVGSCSGTSCNLGLMAPAASATITVVVTATTPAVGSLTNSATVSSDDFDPTLGNNSANRTVYVTACLNTAPGSNIWIGGKNTDWNAPENWSFQTVPTQTDDVFICAQAPNSPVVGATGNSLNNLVLASGSVLQVAGSGALAVYGNVDASVGTITGPGALSMLGTGTSVRGNLGNTIISTATVSLSGPTTFDYLEIGGSLDMGAQTAVVNHDLSTDSGSTLTMQNAAANLTVNGGAYFYGGNNGASLTAGTLNVAGYFYQGCDSQAYAPSGTHLTRFIGPANQSVYFCYNGAGETGSHFQYLTIAKTGGYVDFSGSTYIDADLSVASPTLLRDGYLTVAGSVNTIAGSIIGVNELDIYGMFSGAGSISPYYLYFYGTNQPVQGNFYASYTEVSGSVVLSGDATFTGDFEDYGSLDLNTHTARVGGYFETYGSGALLMTHPTDKLTVYGTAYFYANSSDSLVCGTNPIPCATSILTAGTLEVAGDFDAYYAQDFVASGTHLTRLFGSSTQYVYFSDSSNHFQDLEIANTDSNYGVYLDSPLQIAGTLIKRPGSPSRFSGNGYAINTAGVNVNGLTLDSAPVMIGSGPITAFDNVTFQNMSVYGDQLTINHPGATNAFNFSGLKFLNAPATGYYYIRANDTATDANLLTINVVSATPADGSASTITGAIGGTATLSADTVSAVTVTNGGSGYTTPPTVTFVGGGGSGAAGTAVLTGDVVTGVTITNGGSGYTSAPLVLIDGVPGSAVVNWSTIPLLHWYTFQGDVTDQIGTANGSLVGGATASNGALTLNGSTAYVQFASPIIPAAGSFSVTMFATEASASSAYAEMISQGQSVGGFYIGHDTNGMVRLGDNWISTGVAFPSDGQRHHYALAVDASANLAQFYIDGVLAGTHTAFGINAGDNTKLGAQFNSFGEFFHGTLEDVRIYGGALTAGQVATLVAGQDEGTDLSVISYPGYPEPTAVFVGGNTNGYFQVTNNGAVLAPSAVLTITTPADAVLTGTEACTGTAPTFTCALGDISPNSSSYLFFTLQLNSAGANVISGSVRSAIADANIGNNSASATVNAVNSGSTISDLQLTMTGSPSAVPGGAATYNLTVTNANSIDEPGAVVTLALPAGFTFASTSPEATCTGTSTLTCSLVNPVPGYSLTAFQVTATAGSAGVYLVQASVASPNPDSNTYNNQALVQTIVTNFAYGTIERESVDANNAEVYDSYSEDPTISYTGRFVAFDTYEPFVTNQQGFTDNNYSYDVYMRDNCRGVASGCTPSLIPISVGSDGNAANSDSYFAMVNRSGRYVAFVSYGSNLDPTYNTSICGESCDFSYGQIYVRDTCIGAPAGCQQSTRIVSVSDAGIMANYYTGEYGPPAISSTGRYIAFDSGAESLTPQGAADEYSQVVLRDTCIGAATGCTPSTILVSQTIGGTAPDDYSFHPSISADGRYVAFESDAQYLTFGFNYDYRTHIYVRDTCIGAVGACTPSTTMVDLDANGIPANDYSYNPSINATGRYVAFMSYANNLAPGLINSDGGIQVFVRDTCIGAPAGCVPKTVIASVSTSGEIGNDYSQLGDDYDYGYSSGQAISDDGRLVTFLSYAGNLVPGTPNYYDSEFVRDTCLGVTGPCTPNTRMVETTIDGTAPNGYIYYWGAISGDGSVVAFDSSASNLVPNDTDASSDVFLAGSAQIVSNPYDVSIQAAVSGSFAAPNAPLTYNIQGHNNGSDVTGLTVTAQLPSAAAATAYIGNCGAGSCTPTGSCAGGSCTIALGTLSAGVTYNLTIVTTSPTSTGPIAATFNVTMNQADVNPADNTVTVNSNVVSLAVFPPTITVAPSATQQFTASVFGTSNTAVTWSTTAGTISSTGLFTAPATSTTATVTATLGADPSRTATATVNVVGSSDIAITTAPAGNSGINVTVTNNGPAGANGVILTDTLDRYGFNGATPSQGGCSFSTPVVTCSLGTIAAGGSATVLVSTTAPSLGWASQQFHASSSQTDPNPTNNSVWVGPSVNDFNTQIGSAVNVSVSDGNTGVSGSLTFSSITRPGSTTISATTGLPAPPTGFRSARTPVVFDLSTSADFSGPISVSLAYPASAFRHPAMVHLFHLENGAWVDRTTALNAAASRISGVTASLSPFALFEPVDAVPVANAGADRVVSGALVNGATMALDASASSDADGDALTYRWSGPFAEGATVSGAKPNVTLPFGASQITLVVNDGEVDSPAVTLNVIVSDFGLVSPVSTTTLARGQSATYTVQVASKFGAFQSPVALACATNVPGVTCSATPNVTPGASSADASIVVNTTNLARSSRSFSLAWLAIMFGPFGFAFAGGNRRTRLLLVAVLLLIVVMIACGGGGMNSSSSSSTTQVHPATTVTVTVTGTSGAVQHSSSFNVTVQ